MDGSSTTLIKELHHAGYPGQFQSLSMVGSRALSEALGKEGNGIVISQVVPSPWSPKFAIIEEYRKAMEKSGQKDLDFTGLEGFIVAKTFVEIIKHVGRDLTREKFIAAAENLSVIELGNFPVRFSPTSREGSQFVDIVMIRKDGKFLR
jgi:ABC-type branched-subunit amino acid transport system substrate-binding protein